jgi:hypothetical protein
MSPSGPPHRSFRLFDELIQLGVRVSPDARHEPIVAKGLLGLADLFGQARSFQHPYHP